MADQVAHLNASACAALDLPMDERIRRIRSPRWIGYTRAKQILSQLEEVLTHPKTHRMPSLLVVGDTNAGKTMIANRFVQLHPGYHRPRRAAIVVPVLLMQAPPGPEESRFYEMLIESLVKTSPLRGRVSLAKQQALVLQLLQLIDLQLLIIDDLQNIVTGPVRKQRQFLNVLKSLSNALQIPLVGLGTPEALHAIQADPQLANRFTPVALLTAAAIAAIRSGVEQITAQVLAELDWIPPSQRGRAAARQA
jgi:type II secretory pathway predicted ATPase ExeA